MERSEAVDCLVRLFRCVLPRNPRLRRACNTRFQSTIATARRVDALIRKIRYMLHGMTLRDIVYAHKKSCFRTLRIMTLVFNELRQRGVDANGVMRPVFIEALRASRESRFLDFYFI